MVLQWRNRAKIWFGAYFWLWSPIQNINASTAFLAIISGDTPFDHISTQTPYLPYLGAYLGAPNIVKCCRTEYDIKQRFKSILCDSGCTCNYCIWLFAWKVKLLKIVGRMVLIRWTTYVWRSRDLASCMFASMSFPCVIMRIVFPLLPIIIT